MDNVINTLHIACALSEDAKVPGLHVLVKGALKLGEMVKETRDVQDQCSLLAERAAKLSTAVYCQLSSGISPLDEMTATKHIGNLIETVESIEGLMTRRRKARFIRTFWYRGTIAKELKMLTSRLEDGVQVFDIQSSIHTNQQITMLLQCSEHLLQHAESSERAETALLSGSSRIDSYVQEILHRVRVDATHDGAMRLYARDEVELVEELGVEDARMEPGEEPVVQFSARLCTTGRSVTVRRFPQPDKKFRDAIATAKKIWHPNIVHAIGYSREDPEIAFIVNNGVYTHTYDDLSATFHGTDKFLWTMQTSQQILSGLMHLKSVYGELVWAEDGDADNAILGDTELAVAADGRVLLDVACYDLKELPNTIIHHLGILELHSRARGLVKAFSNPLEGASDQRFAALCSLWHSLASVNVDLSRDDGLFWQTLPVPSVGQCFSLANGWIVDGLECGELVCGVGIHLEYRTPTLCLRPHAVQERIERDGMLDVFDRPGVQDEVVTQWIQESDIIDGEVRNLDTLWRRHTVQNMTYGWSLETVTILESNGGCREWFMGSAVELSKTDEDLDDLVVVYSLRFLTRTHLIQPGSRDGHKAVPPPNLFFYERVHTSVRADLDDTVDWPWGFWSTDPHEDIEPLEIGDEDDIRERKLHITFLGVSQDGEFVWKQRVGHCCDADVPDVIHFDYPVCLCERFSHRVQVSYHRFTPDECLVLREIQRWATPEDLEKSRFNMMEEDDSEIIDADDEGDMMDMDWE